VEETIQIGAQQAPVLFRRHAQARNYILRLHANRTVVVTLPRQGTLTFAREFIASRLPWLEKQWANLETRQPPPDILRPGAQILFRGIPTPLEITSTETKTGTGWELRLGDTHIPVSQPEANLRPPLEAALRALAERELPERMRDLIALHASPVKRITIRGQKSRWGSCSRKGTISLNWRLVQTPPNVRDYILIHELMHLKVMNHSPEFWAEVAKACPDYREAELWLRRNSRKITF
jgi:predicted metal-dependent hydrolase